MWISRPLSARRCALCWNTQDVTGHHTVDFFSAKTGRVFPFDFSAEDGSTIEVRGAMRVAVNDADTHVAAVVAGLGLAQLPLTRYLQELLQTKRLVTVLDSYHPAGLPLQLLYPRNRHLSVRVRAFVEWVVALHARKFEALKQCD